MRPVGVPVVVLGHKWDKFEAEHGEPEKRKVLARCLRFFWHMHGASLAPRRNAALKRVTALEVIVDWGLCVTLSVPGSR